MEWITLTSRQNPVVKEAVALRNKKNRDETGLFSVEGTKFLADLARDGIFPRALFVSQEASVDEREAEESFAGDGTRLYIVSASVYEKLSQERAGEGVFAIFEKSCLPAAPVKDARRVLALEGVQDPGNVGSCVRSAAALGFDEVWISACADPLGQKALRASMGAVFRTPLAYYPDGGAMLAAARERGLITVASCLSPDAVPLDRLDHSRSLCLFVGSEGQGLSDTVVSGADIRTVIPMTGMESLNAAAAAAILMWEVTRLEGHEG